jgi:SAM-dependent methyltransferase
MMPQASNPTSRFSNRVENYTRYRPGYPPAVLDTLRAETGLATDSVIADVGCGTGILSEMFLRNGNTVYGVEPNPEMREAGRRLLTGWPNFTSVEGTAEATTLAPSSVDFVTAAQSLHWFDLPRARTEFERILRPAGCMVVVWNDRLDESPFMLDYRALLLRYSTDYVQVDHKRFTPEILGEFFGGEIQVRTFPNHQVFDLEGLRGRLLSSSYVPLDSAPMLEELAAIFARHQMNGAITFDYVTTLYWGALRGPRSFT